LTDGYDARGVRTQFTYDGLNRVKTATFTGEVNNQTPTVTYSYDSASSGYFNNGRLTKVETASTSTAPTTSQIYDYDLMGRVSKQQQSIGANGTIAAQTYTLEYAYNLAGQLISEKYPSGRRVAYRVDEAGRLSNVFGGGRTYANGFSFAGHGGLLSMNYGNGATESFSYNDRLQLTQQSLSKSNTILQQYDYAYGQVDLNTGTVDATKNTGQLARVEGYICGTPSSPVKQWQQRFSYDSIGRLEKAKEVRGDNSTLVWESKFSYDRFGNRYRKASENPNSLSFTAVEESDVDKATNRISNNTTYDESGNTTTDSKFRNRNYRYDANGRMVWTQATSGGNDSTAIYDALGQRIATKVNNTWRYVVYDIGGKMVAEYGQSSGMSGNNTVRYMMLDRQGSTRVVMDKVGAVAARFDYQPFGEDISANIGQRTTSQGYAGTDTSRQRYGLTERDEATGLDHTWFRKYENTAGRWTSPDPYRGSMKTGNPQSFNQYSYVVSDPINFVDPNGLYPAFAGCRLVVKHYATCVSIVGERPECKVQRVEVYFECDYLPAFARNFIRNNTRIDIPIPECVSEPDPDSPCRADGERSRKELREIAGAIGGSFEDNGRGYQINPNGQSYDEITNRLRQAGFSWYPNVEPSHYGGSDWRGQGSTGLWWHITVGYPKERVTINGGNGKNFYTSDKSKSPPWITADPRCVDPFGWQHISYYLRRKFSKC